MAPARLEVNFVRLLSRCEYITLEKQGETEWRLEKYVGALEDMLRALKRSSSKPTADVLKGYRRKVDYLKGLLNAEKLQSLKETGRQRPGPGRNLIAANEKTPVTRKFHVQRKARSCGDGGCELQAAQPSETGTTETDMRKRRALRLEDWRSGAELDAMLQQQQHLAEDILHLARNLRKSTLASQRLLPHDTQVLSCRAKQDVCEKKWAESEPRYLLWLGLVLVTFISTILFIRLFPELW
ncbi:vesicle transport protein USE1-like isoform X1 [Anguilla rostrata]|uniref:vesicle transport protein USE1-like isoform X1 n=1 Tax=Anguilla rostrata TaxID=7938 RepID=UPI0030D4148F